MLMTLIKKQYWECFRFYFINPKTGKARSRWSRRGIFVLFGALMVMMGGMFFGLSFVLKDILAIPGYGWLFYTLMGSIALLLGVFGSVFNTFSMLYQAKDNELLLAMPIPSSKILLSRMTLVYGMGLLYSGLVWIPTIVFGWIFAEVTAKMVVFQVLLLPVIALLVMVLTCLLGWLVALISTRLRNKNILIVAVSLAFFFGYYYVCMNMTNLLMSIVSNASALGSGLRTWCNLLYQLGIAANGDSGGMLIFLGAAAAASVLCLWVMARSFQGIVTRTRGTGKKSAKITVKVSSVGATLLRRELRRFASSTVYMLNCGFGLVILLVTAGLLVFKRDALQSALSGLTLMMPGLEPYLPVVEAMGLCMIAGMNMVTAPSISLEGKNLWILRSLPVSGREVLRAKLRLHLLLNLPPLGAALAAMAYAMGIKPGTALVSTAFCGVMVWFNGVFGLILGVLRPNFQWTSETVPIKQSLNVMLSMLVSWLVPIAIGVAVWLVRRWLGATEAMAVSVALIAGITAALHFWLNTKGAECFDCL